MFYGWYVAAATFLTLLVTVGIPFYAMPFFYDHFIREFGWSRAQTTSGIALATIPIQPVGELLVHRFSPRRLVMSGAAMLLVSLTLFGLGTGSLPLYYLAWCVFMQGYVFAGPLPYQVMLTQWFRRNRGLAIGLAYLGLGIGGAVSHKYVTLPLIERFGWRMALMGMGASMLLLLPLLVWVARDRPADMDLQADGDQTMAAEMATPPRGFGDLLRQRAFWLQAFGSFCSIGAIGSINQHMKLVFQNAGLPASTVADTTFWILMSSLAGRVIMGWLADRLPKKHVMVAAHLFVAGPIPLLFAIDRPGMPMLFALVFGFGLGADFMLIPLMAAQVFGLNSLACAMGVILPADSIGQTCFPFLLGLLHDRSGNYHAGLKVIIGLALAGAAAIALLPGPDRKMVA